MTTDFTNPHGEQSENIKMDAPWWGSTIDKVIGIQDITSIMVPIQGANRWVFLRQMMAHSLSMTGKHNVLILCNSNKQS